MNATNSTTPPVDESGNDLDQLRARIDAKYYTRSKEKPAPMRQEAFHGLAGEVVKIVAPVTEACPEALLVQLLVCLGNAIGSGTLVQPSRLSPHQRIHGAGWRHRIRTQRNVITRNPRIAKRDRSGVGQELRSQRDSNR